MYNRSNELLGRQESLLLIVDVQEKLMPAISNGDGVAKSIAGLAQAAKLAEVPIIATEQYPQGLGNTVSEVQARLTDPCLEKITFSCLGDDAIREAIKSHSRRSVLVCGVETHVCIQQTALDLLSEGYTVYVAADAVSSRRSDDHDWAIRRMAAQGVTPTTREACLFEWCEQAGTDLFKAIRKLL